MAHKTRHLTFALILKHRRWTVRDSEAALYAWRFFAERGEGKRPSPQNSLASDHNT